MKLTQFNLYAYELPLTRDLLLKGKNYANRSGLIIRLESKDGAIGWGEAAPLPGFSRETLADARFQLLRLRSSLKGSVIPDNLEELSGGFDRWLKKFNLSASVRFGMELASLNLVAADRGVALVDVLSDEHPSEVLVNAFYAEPGEDIPKSVEQAVTLGYRAIKLKVGRQSIAADIKLIRKVCDLLPDDVSLRLDANRAWSFDDAVAFAHAIRRCNVEYIEEPLSDGGGINRLVKQTGLPVALDESLSDMSPDQTQFSASLKAVVLKPTLIGGLETAMKFARKALLADLKAVVTSSYESGLGLTGLAHLAASLNRPGTAHGLDTQSWLADDLIAERLPVDRGVLDIRKLRSSPILRMSLLSEVTGE